MPETVTGKGLSQLPNDPDVMAAGLEYRDSNPLHEATIGGHLEIVQRLIDPVFSLDEKGPNVQIARILLETGADPTRLDVTDAEEIHAVSRETRAGFMTAAYWNAVEVLQLLIDRLLPSNHISPREWEQAVGHAAAEPPCKITQDSSAAAAYCLWDEHEMMLRAEAVLWEAQIQVIRLLLARCANPNWMRRDSPWTRLILHSAFLTA
ncbi:hypothetical protein ALT_6476 [Aspergillus lentulus]|uniref:Uncharacterized protein n=1 Tax=Aspergillus lentulus TaxID=293939 RepID=A0AAN4TCG8_ASPLE|nr:uncharacterized protein IFM58399_09178 [Aspergillus lentulus]KAF4153844.1 hypothetical protein CNMCM6069_000269 [Aspergillus lentulus]KAF4170430.1 hypothetical protein CNMCM8060_005440 [Aspergillus lentulus]KAF4192604.1 hypothetical protein CNMCM8694_000139 [Aspergillus lentulus]KAF4199783.1 hypothetical protein CNMCM8927_004783 [Aspergillus lentulus]GAQ09155.1 hypothetical protein ALT_6476 [Aspergillus lentulus]